MSPTYCPDGCKPCYFSTCGHSGKVNWCCFKGSVNIYNGFSCILVKSAFLCVHDEISLCHCQCVWLFTFILIIMYILILVDHRYVCRTITESRPKDFFLNSMVLERKQNMWHFQTQDIYNFITIICLKHNARIMLWICRTDQNQTEQINDSMTE